MIVQLPNGRIVECSVEQYLSLTDDEIKDLNGLGVVYTKEVGDPLLMTWEMLSANQVQVQSTVM